MNDDAGDRLFGAGAPLHIADQGYFFVGGEYVESADGARMSGQMFVQYQIPARRSSRYPIVMIHGGGQTGTNFLGTPDGRRGWADYFVANGYAVYVVDQPGRGRSGYFPDRYGPGVHRGTRTTEGRFTAPENAQLWPQARHHTQWPGAGTQGDAVFDQFYASQVEGMRDVAQIERLVRAAGAALLDRIGASILLTHSQSGPFGWTIADARPKLVKAIVAVEPQGAPVHEIRFLGVEGDALRYADEAEVTRPWGVTRGPLTFDPPVADATQMKFIKQPAPDAPDLVACWLQAEPARKLVNLAGIPILIVTAEASYHAPYDHCTSRFLAQAGVEHDFVRLAEAGIRGNGHMMMLERNNLEIAAYFRKWLRDKVET